MELNTINDITNFIFIGKNINELSHYDLLIINADWAEKELSKDMKLMLDKNIIDNNTTFIICESHQQLGRSSATILVDYLKKEGLNNKIIVIDKYISNTEILKNIDMGGIGNQVGKVIIKLIIWYIGVALAAGTFGISLVVAFGVDELADELISDSNLDKKRKQRIRKKVAKDIKNHLIEKKSIMMDEFNETLEGQTKNADDIIDDALKTAFEIVTLKRFEM